MMFLLCVVLLACKGLISAEEYAAWYLPEDKLAKYPNHLNFTTNSEIYRGFSLKEPLFKGEENEEVNSQ